MITDKSMVMGITLVFGFGSSVIGTIGTIAELAAKKIDQEKHPILRTVAEVFAKTLQSGAAAFSLVLIGSLSNPLGYVAIAIGVVMLLTPTLNELIQHSSFESLKRGMRIADQAVSFSSKMINTAFMTIGAAMALGAPAAVLTSAAVGALNFLAYKKA